MTGPVEAFVRDMPEIDNPQYLIELLKGSDRKYYQEKRAELIEQGFLEGVALEQFLYGAVLHRRYTIAEEVIYTKAKNQGVAQSLQINRESLKKLAELASQNQKIYETMIKAKAEAEKQKEIHNLHSDTMNEMETFVNSNIGEFSFLCESCGNIVHTNGLPIEGVLCEINKEGERVYYVWNPHLEFMILNGMLSLPYMAFILRTSILGLEYTYKKRTGTELASVVTYDRVKCEAELKTMMENFEEYYKGSKG